MDPGYKKTITPVPEDGSRDLLVNFSFSILDILRIDEVKETFTAKISLTREWRDPRLTYKNLKRGNSNQNDLSKEEAESIWYPSVSINNIENVEKMKPDKKFLFYCCMFNEGLGRLRRKPQAIFEE